jgi:L-ornithine N5-oxygenase
VISARPRPDPSNQASREHRIIEKKESEVNGPNRTGQPYDVVGVGFGPSNLALAIALYEYNQSAPAGRRLTYTFLEKKPVFGWHRGMLIDGATMQVSFLKDLATPRNPSSEFGFLRYLHDNGRLADFINHQILFLTRVEFHDYLEWVASRFAGDVSYGHEVTDVRPVGVNGEVSTLEVVAGGAVIPARNVVLAAGLSPVLPDGVRLSPNVWHSSELLDRLADLPLDGTPAFAVVGAGQSAAEALEYLHRKFPDGHVHSIFSRYGLSPADDSPFVNRIFDPDTVRTFFESSAEAREKLFDYHRNTNYSVVDTDLIKELYRRHYHELVTGRTRLHFHNFSRIVRTVDAVNGVGVEIESLADGGVDLLEVDVIIYATGYRPVDPLRLLGSVAELCKTDSVNRLRLDLRHRVTTTSTMSCGIYVTGASEHIHGLSSSLLSNNATRAGDIVESIVKNTPPHAEK